MRYRYCPDTRCINSYKGQTKTTKSNHLSRCFYTCSQCELRASDEVLTGCHDDTEKLDDKIQLVLSLKTELNRLFVMENSYKTVDQEIAFRDLSLGRAEQMRCEFLQVIKDHISDVYDKLDASLN